MEVYYIKDDIPVDGIQVNGTYKITADKPYPRSPNNGEEYDTIIFRSTKRKNIFWKVATVALAIVLIILVIGGIV